MAVWWKNVLFPWSSRIDSPYETEPGLRDNSSAYSVRMQVALEMISTDYVLKDSEWRNTGKHLSSGNITSTDGARKSVIAFRRNAQFHIRVI